MVALHDEHWLKEVDKELHIQMAEPRRKLGTGEPNKGANFGLAPGRTRDGSWAGEADPQALP
jgi:hypothetical protein